jgi:glutamyl-tRNA synthetase
LIHLPLLRNPDQSKLSKRKNPTSVTYYRDMRYLPEALVNYLSLMGWSMPNEEEIFSRQEMVEAFDVDRMTTGGPIFDQTKLSWLNGQYLRRLDASEYAQRIQDWMLNTTKLEQLIPMVQERAERLSDLLPLVNYLLGNLPELRDEHFEHKSMERGDVLKVLHHTLAAFDEMRGWQRDDLFALCQGLAQAMELKFRDFLFPLFVATSGRAVSLPLFDSWMFLGADLSRARLRSALEFVGASKKERKRLDKEYQAIKAVIDSAAMPT